jgi:hypothetical protein
MKLKTTIYTILILFLITSSTYAKKNWNSYARNSLNKVKLYNIEIIDVKCVYIFEPTTTLYILGRNENGKRLYIILRSKKALFGSGGPWYILRIDQID